MEITKKESPVLGTSEKGTYHGIFLAPMNHLERITNVLTEMAKTDEELAKAIAEGKKTFEGCDRYIRNNMADLMREMHAREVTFCDEDVHLIARWYMCNPDAVDAQNTAKAVAAVKKAKTEKVEKKPKKANITVTRNDMFDDSMFDDL